MEKAARRKMPHFAEYRRVVSIGIPAPTARSEAVGSSWGSTYLPMKLCSGEKYTMT